MAFAANVQTAVDCQGSGHRMTTAWRRVPLEDTSSTGVEADESIDHVEHWRPSNQTEMNHDWPLLFVWASGETSFVVVELVLRSCNCQGSIEEALLIEKLGWMTYYLMLAWRSLQQDKILVNNQHGRYGCGRVTTYSFSSFSVAQ